MSDTAAAQFRRLLDALPRFAERPTQSLAALSETLGVEAAALVRDFAALAERYDDPAGFVEGVAVNIDGDQVTVRTDHFCRPMRLTHSELCALELGLALLARESPRAATPQILALRDRLATLITILPQDRGYAGYRDGALATDGRDSLDIVRQALRRRRVLRIGYQGAQQDAASERDVHPWRLVFSQVATLLATHRMLEEQHFYPELREALPDAAEINEAQKALETIRRMAEDIHSIEVTAHGVRAARQGQQTCGCMARRTHAKGAEQGSRRDEGDFVLLDQRSTSQLECTEWQPQERAVRGYDQFL